MIKNKFITILLVCFFILQFMSCDFVVKDKEGSPIKVDYDEDNSLIEDEKLDKLLEDYTSSFEDLFDEDEEQEMVITAQQKQEILKKLNKARSIAKEITSYIENFKHGDIADNCRESIEKLKKGDANLDISIQHFSTINTQKPTVNDGFIILEIGVFSEYAVLAINTRIECSFSLDIFK